MSMEDFFHKHLNRNPSFIGEQKFSKYAIFLPLIKMDEEYHILFEIRAYHMRRQPGEICFPGGKIESNDINPMETAFRETFEELNIRKEDVLHLFPLDYKLSPFGTIIYPYAGLINSSAKIVPNSAEVAKSFTVPIKFFMNNSPKRYQVNFKVEPERDFPFHAINGGENYNWQIRKMEELFYFYKEYTIWGLTASILKHFIDMLKSENLSL